MCIDTSKGDSGRKNEDLYVYSCDVSYFLEEILLLLWLFGANVNIAAGRAGDVCWNETSCSLLFCQLADQSEEILDGLRRGLNVKD